MSQDKNAANDGDLLKHAILSELLKQCAHWHSLTYAETHAGAGIYTATNQTSEKPYIRTLQSKIVELPKTPVREAGGQYTSLLKNWWMKAENDGLYPGSVYQAALLLKNNLENKDVVFRVTEACEETYKRLTNALAESGVKPELSGFQFKIDWLTENNPLVLLIDPFAYAEDASGLSKGYIDLGTLRSLLAPCWRKRACIVGFWCAGPHSTGPKRRAKFMESLKSLAIENKAALRAFQFGQFSMTVIGIGSGKQVVSVIPRTKDWVKWLRRIVKEDLSYQVTAASDPANTFDDLPQHLPKEVVQTLIRAADVRIERIISHGHASPADFWYDQPQHEWVIVLKGAARLQFEDGMVEMKVGDFINIPAFKKHRVDWTTPDEPTVWLGVRYGGTT
jgi:cupin 2 domain-containing protein